MACEGMLGMITITTRVIRLGFVFQPNTQWCYKRIDNAKRGCGCSGNPKINVRLYVVEINGIEYSLDERFVVETTVEVPVHDQDTMSNFTHVGDNYGFSFQDLLIKPDPDKIFAEAQRVIM